MRRPAAKPVTRVALLALLLLALVSGCGGGGDSDRNEAADAIEAYDKVAIRTYRGVDRQLSPVSFCLSREGTVSPQQCEEPCRECVADLESLRMRFAAAYEDSPEFVRRIYRESYRAERDYLNASIRFMSYMLDAIEQGASGDFAQGERLAKRGDRLSRRVPRVFERDQDEAAAYLEDL